MTYYKFSVTRLGEKETHKIKASSKNEDEAWKILTSKVDMRNVDKVILVTIG